MIYWVGLLLLVVVAFCGVIVYNAVQKAVDEEDEHEDAGV